MKIDNKKPSELRAAVAELKPYFRRATVFGIFAALLVLAPSWYMLEVYDRAVGSRNHLTLIMLTLAVLWAYSIMEVLEWARGQLMHAAGLALDRKLGDRIFSATFIAFMRRQPGGSVQSMNDFRTVREFFTSPAIAALTEMPVSLVFMVLLFVIHPWLGVLATAGAIVQATLAWANERSTQPPLVLANRTAASAQQYADGLMRNAPVVEAMGMQRDIHARWMAKQREFLTLQAGASESAAAFQAGTRFTQQVLSSALLGLGAFLLLNGGLTGGAGMMIVASILGGRMLAPITQLIVQWKLVVQVRDSWARLDALLAAIDAKSDTMSLPAPRGSLQVEQVIAGAPGMPNAPILRGISFQLKPGEVLAVVGPSASGKSSMARLLVGLWPTASGKVRLDGADVYAWDKSELGPHVGYLPQEVELFDGTLAENIARFGQVDRERIEEAARLVGLHEFILGLPEGYESAIGGEGTMLSGGQRQRVGLARALYGSPVFVVLDEPNSSLDEEGDAALAEAVRTLKARGTTFVLMTHRTSVLSVSDKLLVLRDGAQQAFGPRDEVMAALKAAAQQGQQPPQQARPGAPGSVALTPAATAKTA